MGQEGTALVRWVRRGTVGKSGRSSTALVPAAPGGLVLAAASLTERGVVDRAAARAVTVRGKAGRRGRAPAAEPRQRGEAGR